MKKISIIGTDSRSVELRKLYLADGTVLYDYKKADVIIAPIPFTKDGRKINSESINIDEFVENINGKILLSGAYLKDIISKLKNINYYDIMKEESLAILNAIPTAEGAIYEAIKNTNTTLCNSNVLVMGYGKIGKVLSKMLAGIGANVYCEARNKKDLAFIKSMGYNEVDINELKSVLNRMDYIFNTIPVTLLDEEMLKYVKKDVIIIDLASVPGGVDYKKAKEYGINVVWALSLPSKVASKSSAVYLKNTIDSLLENDRIDFKNT